MAFLSEYDCLCCFGYCAHAYYVLSVCVSADLQKAYWQKIPDYFPVDSDVLQWWIDSDLLGDDQTGTL